MFGTSRQQLLSVPAPSFWVPARVAAPCLWDQTPARHWHRGMKVFSACSCLCSPSKCCYSEKKRELNGTTVAGCKKYFLECPSCMARQENRAEMNGGERERLISPEVHFAAFSVWIYTTHYCCKPTLVAVGPDCHNLIWIFMLSLWCQTPFQRSTSCHLQRCSRRLIQTHPGQRCWDLPGKWLEMLNVVVVFLQSYPGPWFLDYFITVNGDKKGEWDALLV